ncbi:hypothetical protein TDB9533_00637 [Thalassocella blandensis]|nr:hypothetical protein TDB9533_00637 [Thalassocella blandensis]
MRIFSFDWRQYSLGLVLFASAIQSSYAQDSELKQPNAERESVWTFSMDNDLFAPAKNNDRDFTGGIALTYSTNNPNAKTALEKNTLGKLDRLLGINKNGSSAKTVSSIELGSYGFTPNYNEQYMQDGDRPFSSIVYLSLSRVYETDLPEEDAWTSTLTIGALGWDIFSRSQNAIHNLVGDEEVEGWDSQISDGGELTFRYQVAYHDFWASNQETNRFKTSYFASLGYVTEAGIAISTRQGLISSSSQRFTPELINYGEQVNHAAISPYAGEENYFWAGMAFKYRAYNAFLQGQFRDSEYELDADEVRQFIAEAWLGYTASFSNRFKLSYVLRGQTSEMKTGDGDRGMIWAGLVLSHSSNVYSF